MEKQSKLVKIIIYITLAVVMMFVLFPFIWMITSSIKPQDEIFAVIPKLFPSAPTFEGYKWALSEMPGANIVPLLINSLTVSGITAIAVAFFAATGGYAIGRYKFPGLKIVIVFLMIAQMFQGPIIMVPWYKMAANMGILNTKTALVLIYLTATIPIGVWLMSGFFKGIPKELEEAAYIDGCSKAGTFWRIILPLAKGGLVSIILYSFIIAWNDYQYALILTNSVQAKTVQIGIGELMDSMGKQNWGGIMACGVIITIPAVILFSIIQKYLIEGLTAGAVKG